MSVTRSATLRSLAKINLDLRVLQRREDGYHELRTVFQTISLADVIEVAYTAAKRTRFTIDDDLQIPNNLILRAADSALHAMKVSAEVRFRLKKQIPMGAGLGGGSSNAAAVLLALPVLAGRALPIEHLMELGAALGSDVPFFLDGGTAIGLGRGTEMYALPDIRREPILLLTSGIHVGTAQAYQSLSEKLTSQSVSPKINNFRIYTRTLMATRSAGAASAQSANDFESAVFGLHPQLKRLYDRLRKACAKSVTVRMTGSGSALFVVFESIAERDRVRAVMASGGLNEDARVLSANLVNGSGYRQLWRRQLGAHISSLKKQQPRQRQQWPLQSRYAT